MFVGFGRLELRGPRARESYRVAVPFSYGVQGIFIVGYRVQTRERMLQGLYRVSLGFRDYGKFLDWMGYSALHLLWVIP